MPTTETIPTKLPIGLSNFETLIGEGYYYVDKTLFIKDILDKGAVFTLCTRPRRFGKTLNQSMIRCFFEDTAPLGVNDRRPLFDGLKIEKAGERYMAHQGKYPVIFLSFKDAGKDTFENSYGVLRDRIAEEFERHRYIYDKISADNQKRLFEKLASCVASKEEYSTSIRFLSQCLEKYHGQKTIVLIDEYDVALENAWRRGFYDDMVEFIRSLMGSALKDNEYLQFAIMAGCLCIAQASIFTGPNNVGVTYGTYYKHYGFSQDEVDALLRFYGFENKSQTVKDLYNGYIFGNEEVYNPGRIIDCINDWVGGDIECTSKRHCAHKDDSDIVRQLVDRANGSMITDIETLMSGGIISKEIRKDITFADVDKNVNNLWTFLLFTGYLKKLGERLEDVHIISDLSIPNKEILCIYKSHIQESFKNRKLMASSMTTP